MDAGWLECLHRDNVTLVSEQITQITPSGIVTADGQQRDFDVIVYATGSDVAEHGVGVNEGLRGENEVELKEYWKSIGGPQSYLGLAVPGVSAPLHSFSLDPRTARDRVAHSSSQTTSWCSARTPRPDPGGIPSATSPRSSLGSSKRCVLI